MNSVHSRLLITLSGVFIAAWVIVGIFAYIEARHEVEELFDAELVQSAKLLYTLLESEIREDEELHYLTKSHAAMHEYESSIAFQVWKGDQLVARSQFAPESRIQALAGFTFYSFNNQQFRLFSMHGDLGISVNVIQSLAVRNELTGYIIRSIIQPLFIALPILMLLLWFLIGAALRPLQQVATEVETRHPEDLSPLESKHIPSEISVLISSLNALFSRLRTAFEREQRFTADAAHELRTPMAAIKTQAQVALRSSDGDQQAMALKQIDSGVDRATRLIEQLLTMARVDPEASSRNFIDVDLCKVVTQVVADLAPCAGKKNIDLGMEHCAVVIMRGIEPALMTLARNIIENAVNYTRQGGEVNVSVLQKDEEVVLLVCDNGPGIDPQQRERVFERFYRDVNQASTVQGSGLGLSIVKRIADIHHADIVLDEPDEGDGLIFKVVFPQA
ncbi:MAG: sensor histidine kinase N-terminal domain-containing protein [Gammaproteobacteria bacterium]|nr:sensor histidine kinase N-terminal domain-containing protein [Gammaproteobacteria bacterium]